MAFFKGRLHVNGALVARALKEEGNVLFCQDKFAVYEDVDVRQEFLRFPYSMCHTAQEIPVEEIACKAPNILLGILCLNLAQERQKAFLVDRLHRFAA